MRVNRLLSIVLIISSKGRVTAKELAEYFEVSVRTIYRDVEKIAEAGVPIAGNGGKGGGFYIMENYNLKNLFLDKGQFEEVMPIVNNLKELFGKNQKFNDMILKLENIYGKYDEEVNNKLNINISHFNMEEELKEYLYCISKAIDESLMLEFDYINRRMECSKRCVEPVQISFSYGNWYLIGFCRERCEYRNFKLVRMRNINFGQAFTKKHIKIDEIKSKLEKGYNEKSIKVILKFSSRIRDHLIEHFNKDKIKVGENNCLLVEDYFPYEEGLLKFIISFGRDCEVLEPKYLVNETKEYLKDMYSKY